MASISGLESHFPQKKKTHPSWWLNFNPFEKYARSFRQLDLISPENRGRKLLKIFETNHHLDICQVMKNSWPSSCQTTFLSTNGWRVVLTLLPNFMHVTTYGLMLHEIPNGATYYISMKAYETWGDSPYQMVQDIFHQQYFQGKSFKNWPIHFSIKLYQPALAWKIIPWL